MKITVIVLAILIGPILLAGIVAGYQFSSGALSGRADGWDGYGEVFASYVIMFCIAVWIGGGLTFVLLRLRGKEDEP